MNVYVTSFGNLKMLITYFFDVIFFGSSLDVSEAMVCIYSTNTITLRGHIILCSALGGFAKSIQTKMNVV